MEGALVGGTVTKESHSHIGLVLHLQSVLRRDNLRLNGLLKRCVKREVLDCKRRYDNSARLKSFLQRLVNRVLNLGARLNQVLCANFTDFVLRDFRNIRHKQLCFNISYTD